MIFKNQAFYISRDISLWFLTAGFLLYALWGSPTPNNPDWVEVTIALLLILAIGISSIFQNFFFNLYRADEKCLVILKIFFVFGIVIGLLNGVIAGHDISVLMRDVIAFIFLCLPLFLYNYLKDNEYRQKIFFYLCLLIGVFFAIRVLVPHFLLFRNTTELLYLANSPLVLMSGLFFLGQAGFVLYRNTSLKNFIIACTLIGLASLPLMAMFVDLQRASFAALVLSFMTLFTIGIVKAPMRMIIPTLIIILFGILFYDLTLTLLSNVGEKTAQVGLNMRLQELQAVWQVLSYSPWNILLGQGWGAQFFSPAVGNIYVGYTHSLISYVFFKLGLLGLFLCLIYLYFIFEKWVRLYFSNGIKGNALIWPFIIPIFLYASHKSFDFGVLLTLILISANMVENKKEVALP